MLKRGAPFEPPNRVKLIDDMESAKWTAQAGTTTWSAAWAAVGSKSTLMEASAINTACSCRKAISLCLSGVKSISFAYKRIEPLADNAEINLYIYLTDDNYASHLLVGPVKAVGGASEAHFSLDDGVIGGTGTASRNMTATSMQIYVGTNSGGETTRCYIDNVRFNAGQAPVLLIDADDIWSDTYTKIWPYTLAAGLPLGIFCVGSFIGEANRCTLAQLQEMWETPLANGSPSVEIHNHGWTHLNLQTGNEGGPCTYQQVYDEFEQQLELQVANEWTRHGEHLIAGTRSGRYNDTAMEAIEDLGMVLCRNGQQANMTPWFKPDPFHSTSMQPDGLTTSFAAFKALWWEWLIQSRQILDVILHLVPDGAPSSAQELNYAAWFVPFIDYAVAQQSAGRLQVLTQTGAWNRREL